MDMRICWWTRGDVGGHEEMLVDVRRCWWTTEDVGGRQEMLVDDRRCWRSGNGNVRSWNGQGRPGKGRSQLLAPVKRRIDSVRLIAT